NGCPTDTNDSSIDASLYIRTTLWLRDERRREQFVVCRHFVLSTEVLHGYSGSVGAGCGQYIVDCTIYRRIGCAAVGNSVRAGAVTLGKIPSLVSVAVHPLRSQRDTDLLHARSVDVKQGVVCRCDVLYLQYYFHGDQYA